MGGQGTEWREEERGRRGNKGLGGNDSSHSSHSSHKVHRERDFLEEGVSEPSALQRKVIRGHQRSHRGQDMRLLSVIML